MSQAVINLKGAKRILSEKSRWNRGFLAADDEGEDVSPLSDEAVCFCAIGAEFNESTWNDFSERPKFHCRGKIPSRSTGRAV